MSRRFRIVHKIFITITLILTLANFIKLFLFALLSGLLITQQSIAHDLYCKDWIAESLKLNEAQKQDIEEWSHDNNHGMAARYSDSKGAKVECHDKFPSWGERMKIERTSEDPSNNSYKVTRQYCWGRNIFAKGSPCGWFDVKWCWIFPCGFYYDRVQYTSWGDEKSGSLSQDAIKGVDSFESNCIQLLWGSNSACLVRIPPGKRGPDDAIPENTNDNLDLICAYYKGNMWAGIIGRAAWNASLIGCVAKVPEYGPPTFNKVFLSPSILTVEMLNDNDYIKKDSSFIKPIVQIRYQSGGSVDVDEKLDLTYDFYSNFNDNCKKFPNAKTIGNEIEYCPSVNTSNPGRVCVVTKTNTATELGCANRILPEEGNKKDRVIIYGEYAEYTDESGVIYPAIELMFLKRDYDTQKADIRDENNDLVYRSDEGTYFKYLKDQPEKKIPASGKIIYNKINPSQQRIVIREYYKNKLPIAEGDTSEPRERYSYQRDSATAYGLKFNAIIPEFENGEIKKIAVFPQLSDKNEDQCYVLQKSDIKDKKPIINGAVIYSVPSVGNRENTDCQPSYIKQEDRERLWSIPPAKTCVMQNATLTEHNKEAEHAICPGVVTSGASKICLEVSNDWGSITDGGLLPKNIDFTKHVVCAPIPKTCKAVPLPSKESGYAIWDKSDNNVIQTGVCDQTFGFTEKITYSLNPKESQEKIKTLETEISNLENELERATDDTKKKNIEKAQEVKIRELQIINTNYIAVQNKLKTLQKTADDEGRNISKNEIENIKHFEDFKITSQEFKPTKQCAGGVFSKNLINPCVKIEGCPKLKAAPANCNAEWLGAPLGSEATVNGICKTPFKQNSAAPKRQCNVTLDADSKKVLTQTWGDCYIPCVQQ